MALTPPVTPTEDFFIESVAACETARAFASRCARPSLDAVGRRADTSERSLEALKHLARYLVSMEDEDGDAHAVREAIFTYASTLSSRLEGVRLHRTLTDPESPVYTRLAPEQAVERLGDEARRQLGRARRASESLAGLDLFDEAGEETRIVEDVHERDEALQACVHLEEAHLAGLRAMQRRHDACARRADFDFGFSSVDDDDVIGGASATTAQPAGDAERSVDQTAGDVATREAETGVAPGDDEPAAATTAEAASPLASFVASPAPAAGAISKDLGRTAGSLFKGDVRSGLASLGSVMRATKAKAAVAMEKARGKVEKMNSCGGLGGDSGGDGDGDDPVDQNRRCTPAEPSRTTGGTGEGPSRGGGSVSSAAVAASSSSSFGGTRSNTAAEIRDVCGREGPGDEEALPWGVSAALRSVSEEARAADEAARRRLKEIAERVVAANGDRRAMLEDARRAVAEKMQRARRRLEVLTRSLEDRVRAETLLAELQEIQRRPEGTLVRLKKQLRKAERKLEELEDDDVPYSDPRYDELRTKVEAFRREYQVAKLRRDRVVWEIGALGGERRGDPSARDDEVPADASAAAAEGEAIRPFAFPDLALRAHRVVHPREAYEAMSSAQRARADMETMLGRSGLLASDRTYDDYDMSRDAVPRALREAIGSKPNVKGALLRDESSGEDDGSATAEVKVLKSFNVDEFRRVQRAISLAGRTDIRGVVHVECAFLENKATDVVVQMPYHPGGNFRDWAARHRDAANDGTSGRWNQKTWRAAQRVSEAVASLHEHGFLHRDLKPENIVFDGEGEDAVPALCDFDLATNVAGTLAATTQMRGTLLYMSPDAEPSRESDVYALGVTLLESIVLGASELPTNGGLLDRSGTIAKLRELRSRGGTTDAEQGMLSLVEQMIAVQPRDRPSARHVADEMARLLDCRTCCVCTCLESRENGIFCGGEDASQADARRSRHFTCKMCVSHFLSTRIESISDDCKAVTCPIGSSCNRTTPLGVALSCASPDAGNALIRNVESLMQKEMQSELDRLKREHESKLSRMSEDQRIVHHRRKEIEELVLLRCPRCQQAFADFDGCLALTCANGRCRAGFCGLCLKDCGADAHNHVKQCGLNPTRGEFFLPEGRWRAVVRTEVQKKLRRYWEDLEGCTRSGHVSRETLRTLSEDASVRSVFRDQGLAPPGL